MEDGWEDPQGRGAHQAQCGKGLGLTAHVPGPWTPSPPPPLPTTAPPYLPPLLKVDEIPLGTNFV